MDKAAEMVLQNMITHGIKLADIKGSSGEPQRHKGSQRIKEKILFI